MDVAFVGRLVDLFNLSGARSVLFRYNRKYIRLHRLADGTVRIVKLEVL